VSADILRRAAELLRERAQDATPGPWMHVDHGPPPSTFMGCGQVVTMGPDVTGGDIAGPTGDCYPRGGYSPFGDMAYVALMHPPVALALADWLDVTAQAMADSHAADPDDPVELSDEGEAVAVARAILREDG